MNTIMRSEITKPLDSHIDNGIDLCIAISAPNNLQQQKKKKKID
jgi:hypothetical protein